MAEDSESEQVLTWKIENFSYCYCRERLQCHQFTIEKLNAHCYLRLSFVKGGNGYKRFLALTFMTDLLDIESAFDLKIDAFGARGKKLKSVKCQTTSISRAGTPGTRNKWVCPEFIDVKEVMHDAKNSNEDTLTLCLHVYGKSSKEHLTWLARTVIGMEQVTYKLAGTYKNETMESVKQYICIDNVKAFELIISYANGAFKLNISSLQSSVHDCIAKCKFILLNVDGQETFHAVKFEHLFKNVPESWVFYSPIISTELKDNSSMYVKNDLVQFLYTFSCSRGVCLNYIEPITKTNTSIAPPSLREDISSLFLDKQFTDFKLKVGDKEIGVHKNILATRSPVFFAMFNQDMVEAATGQADIVDIDFNTLCLFLEFLYTDTVNEMDYKQAKSLLIASDKYQVLSLREKCATFLESKMSMETVCELLSIADLVGHDHLKSIAIDFMISESKTILSSPQWLSAIKDNLTLANEVLVKVSTTFSSALNTSSSDHNQMKKIRLQ